MASPKHSFSHVSRPHYSGLYKVFNYMGMPSPRSTEMSDNLSLLSPFFYSLRPNTELKMWRGTGYPSILCSIRPSASHHNPSTGASTAGRHTLRPPCPASHLPTPTHEGGLKRRVRVYIAKPDSSTCLQICQNIGHFMVNFQKNLLHSYPVISLAPKCSSGFMEMKNASSWL